MHFFFPEQSLHICLSSAIALSWLKLKAQIEAALSKHFSGIFFISLYHYTHNPFFSLTPVMISFIPDGGEGIYLN